jgi:signal transduction histidine kinase
MSNDSAPPLKIANGWQIRQPLAVGAWSLFLFLFYALVAYVVALSIIGFFVGYEFRNGSSAPPFWMHVTSFIPVILTAWPVQKWIRRQVAHLMAWETSNPKGFMNQLAQQIVTTQTADQLIPTLVQQLATMLDAPYVAIKTPYAALSAASGEPPAAPPIVLPLHYGGETLGHLHIAPRELAGMPVQFDKQLLTDVARQVSLTLWAAQLSADLQASRLRIVTAREEARRQLRRDLHDGLGAGLASITLQADTALELVRDDAETAVSPSDQGRRSVQAVSLLQSLLTQSEETTHELRRIIHDLRPPVLDDVGLLGALQALVNIQTATRFELKLPPTLPPLPAAVEIALYRIAQEAITNIIKHAGATQATITLELSDEAAILTIQDDGQGLLAGRPNGVGLHSMRERAEELGGRVAIQTDQPRGCLVTAHIPLRGLS